MKRFISAMLVALLLVSSFATVAFAAEDTTVNISANDVTAEAGDSIEIPFYVSGADFAGYDMTVTTEEGITIEGFTFNLIPFGAGNPVNGNVSATGQVNVKAEGALFTVTVKIADDIAAGEYTVDLIEIFLYNASTTVLDVVVDPCVITIEAEETEAPTEAPTEPPHVHAFGEWVTVKASTCIEKGLAERVCECGEKETKELDYGAHVFDTKWDYNTVSHYHLCTVCKEAISDKAPHDMNKWVTVKPATDEDPILIQHECCTVCDYFIEHKYDMTPGEDNPDPTGDISGAVNTGLAVLVISLCSVAAIVIKRKTAV